MNIDLNVLISSALTAAIQQSLEPLTQRIEQLERHRDYLRDRISTLHDLVFNDDGSPKFAANDDVIRELNAVINVTEAHAGRLRSLENKVGAGTDNSVFYITEEACAMIEGAVEKRLSDRELVCDTMDRQEWFWDKINGYVDRHLEARGVYTDIEKLGYARDSVLHLEGQVGEIEDRLNKFRECEGADPVPFETVLMHHAGALVEHSNQIEELNLDEDYLKHDIVMPMVRRLIDQTIDERVDSAISGIDFEDLIKDALDDYDFTENIDSALGNYDLDERIKDTLNGFDFAEVFDINEAAEEAAREVLRRASIHIDV